MGCLLALVSLLGACATGTSPTDPFEPFNRGIYQFNEDVDKAILSPTARAYRTVVPQFVRTGVGNFFSNIADLPIALNNALQGKLNAAASDLGRFAANTIFGAFGFFDVATKAGLEKHREDFGQTLGWWGIGDGPFLMLPLFGPSTGRDLAGFVVDFVTDPIRYVDPSRAVTQLSITRAINRRAELLEAGTLLEDAALDKYQFFRDGHLQRRRALIFDGKPPADKDSIAPLKLDAVPGAR